LRSSSPTPPPQLEQVVRNHVQLNTSRDGDSTTSSGNLCQHIFTFTVKIKVLSHIQMEFNAFQLYSLLLSLSLDTTESERSLAPSSFPPIRCLYTLIRSPLRLLFSKLKSSSSLSLSSYKRCSSPLTILWLCATHPIKSIIFIALGNFRVIMVTNTNSSNANITQTHVRTCSEENYLL